MAASGPVPVVSCRSSHSNPSPMHGSSVWVCPSLVNGPATDGQSGRFQSIAPVRCPMMVLPAMRLSLGTKFLELELLG